MADNDKILTEWPKKKEKKIRKQSLIKQLKVQGNEHVNHKGRLIVARKTGEACR